MRYGVVVLIAPGRVRVATISTRRPLVAASRAEDSRKDTMSITISAVRAG
ncbi:hypothetical protein ACWCP6_20000 [Streptomyces sp. NPDC002004]